MSEHESKELSNAIKGGVVVAVILGIVLVTAVKHDALEHVTVAQAATLVQSGGDVGNGPTGYFPDRFREARFEDATQPEAF